MSIIEIKRRDVLYTNLDCNFSLQNIYTMNIARNYLQRCIFAVLRPKFSRLHNATNLVAAEDVVGALVEVLYTAHDEDVVLYLLPIL